MTDGELMRRLLRHGAEARPMWRLVHRAEDGQAWQHQVAGQSAIWSIDREADGRVWLHISTARRDREPTWSELVKVKEWFAGTDTYGYQVCPPRSLYVNIHEFTLHMFVPLFRPPLPEFSDGHGNL